MQTVFSNPLMQFVSRNQLMQVVFSNPLMQVVFSNPLVQGAEAVGGGFIGAGLYNLIKG
jgi:hypothetical protein